MPLHKGSILAGEQAKLQARNAFLTIDTCTARCSCKVCPGPCPSTTSPRVTPPLFRLAWHHTIPLPVTYQAAYMLSPSTTGGVFSCIGMRGSILCQEIPG